MKIPQTHGIKGTCISLSSTGPEKAGLEYMAHDIREAQLTEKLLYL